MASALVAAAAAEQPPMEVGEYDLKSAFVITLGKFVTAPGGVVSEKSVIRLAILGEDPFGEGLDELLASTYPDATTEVIRCSSVEGAGACDLLYIAESERARLAEHLGQLAHRPVITVSDMSQFADAGGMVELFMMDRRMRFSVNIDAAESAHLRLSYKLIKLAVHVHHGSKEDPAP